MSDARDHISFENIFSAKAHEIDLHRIDGAPSLRAGALTAHYHVGDDDLLSLIRLTGANDGASSFALAVTDIVQPLLANSFADHELGRDGQSMSLEGDHPSSIGGAGFHGAPPPASQVTGQLWFGAQGETGGTSTGYSDDHVGHIDSDAGGRDTALINTEGVQQGFQAVGLDTSAGLYFALDGDHTLRSGHMTATHQSGETSQIQETQTQFGSGVNADEVNALAVDPVNHIVYVEIFGQTDNTTALVKVVYDPTTGTFTYPYNTTNGTITDPSKVVMS